MDWRKYNYKIGVEVLVCLKDRSRDWYGHIYHYDEDALIIRTYDTTKNKWEFSIVPWDHINFLALFAPGDIGQPIEDSAVFLKPIVKPALTDTQICKDDNILN